MPMKRRFSKERDTPHVTTRAVRLFDALRRCRCTCEPDERFECTGCKRYFAFDEELMHEFKLGRVVFPTIESPKVKNPYPLGSEGYLFWQPDREAQERWRLLAEASREARRARARAVQPAAASDPALVN